MMAAIRRAVGMRSRVGANGRSRLSPMTILPSGVSMTCRWHRASRSTTSPGDRPGQQLADLANGPSNRGARRGRRRRAGGGRGVSGQARRKRDRNRVVLDVEDRQRVEGARGPRANGRECSAAREGRYRCAGRRRRDAFVSHAAPPARRRRTRRRTPTPPCPQRIRSTATWSRCCRGSRCLRAENRRPPGVPSIRSR